MVQLVALDVNKEITAVINEYHIDKIEIIAALQQSLTENLGRDVLVVQDDANTLKVLKRNKSGEFSEVKYKAFKKGKKTFGMRLESIAKEKHAEKVASMFQPSELIEGLILDRTTNGYFVVAKGEKAFLPKRNSYTQEYQKGMYALDNKIMFQVEKIIDGKVYLTRKSLKITQFTIQSIINRSIKLKQIKKGVLLFCSKPYLDESQMAMIRASVPHEIIFKKEKEGL